MKAAIAVPTIFTDRLKLAPLSSAHSAGMFAMWSSPEVCRYSGPAFDLSDRPIRLPAETPHDSDAIIAFFLKGAADGERIRWAMHGRADGVFIGAVGFNELGRCSEFAYHLRPEFWGRGLMMEGGQAAVEWLRQRAGAAEVEAFIAPENAPSIRLAERLGMRATGETADDAKRYLMALPALG